MALHAEAFATRIVGLLERGICIPHARGEDGRVVGAGLLEQQRFAACGHDMIGDRRQFIDLDPDERERVFGDGLLGRDNDGDGLADIAHLVARYHRLQVGLGLRYGVLAKRDDRHLAHISGRDHRDDAGM